MCKQGTCTSDATHINAIKDKIGIDALELLRLYAASTSTARSNVGIRTL
jgi:hypothetical protein